MPIAFTCPHCGLETDVPEQYAGQTGPCAGCGMLITVPDLVVGSPSGMLTAGTTAVRPRVSPEARSSLRLSMFIFAGMCCMIVVFGVLYALLAPAISNVRSSVRVTKCTSNLASIFQAMEAYHDANGTYPPAYSVDSKGNPLHSWRVLILPFLGTQAESVYRSIDLNEAWDSPVNIQAASRMPDVYACPADPEHPFDETSYAVIVGPNTLFHGQKASQRSECSDGLGETLMLVEVHESGINWMSPIDITDKDLANGINSGAPSSCCSRHPRQGMNALFADGTVTFLSELITPEELRALSTKDGNEQIVLPEF